MTFSLISPVTEISISQVFGEDPEYYSNISLHPGWCYPGHNGIDYAGSLGDLIHAAAGGTCSIGFEEGGYGNYVKIDHHNGYYTYYAHLDGVAVSNGQEVAAGEYIGTMGDTGNAYGVHLHFGVKGPGGDAAYKGYLDPASFFAAPVNLASAETLQQAAIQSAGETTTQAITQNTAETSISTTAELLAGLGTSGTAAVAGAVLNIRSKPDLCADFLGSLPYNFPFPYRAVLEISPHIWLEVGDNIYCAAYYDGQGILAVPLKDVKGV